MAIERRLGPGEKVGTRELELEPLGPRIAGGVVGSHGLEEASFLGP